MSETKMSNERCIDLLNSIVNHVSCARNTSETIQELLLMGFEGDELIHVFNFTKDDVEDAINEFEEEYEEE